jgi:hypothetical protein
MTDRVVPGAQRDAAGGSRGRAWTNGGAASGSVAILCRVNYHYRHWSVVKNLMAYAAERHGA